MGTVHSLQPALPTPGDHVLHLYGGDADYYDKLVDYLYDALCRGHAAIAVVTMEHRRGLIERLAGRGLDVADAIARRQLELCDAEGVRDAIAVGDHASAERFAELITTRVDRALEQWPGLAAVGEIVDLLAAEARYGAMMELEELWNQLQRERPFTLWCAYRMENFAGAATAPAFGSVCASHNVHVHREKRAAKVLVVDDNQDSAEMVAEALMALGHEVAVAHDGPHALAEAAVFEPQIVLLDLGLPTMDGFEVARRLRANGSRVHLVALTGYGQASDRAATREAGFDAHLVKPVDLKTLQRAIAAAADLALI